MRKLINWLYQIWSNYQVKKMPQRYCKRLAKCPNYSDCKKCELFKPDFQMVNSNLQTYQQLEKISRQYSSEFVDKIPNPGKIIPYLKVASHKIITELAITTGARFSEIFKLSVGDFRSIKVIKRRDKDLLSNDVEEPLYHLRFIGKACLPRYILLRQKTLNAVLNYCNNERKDIDKNHRCFTELEDSEKIFINQRGDDFSPISFDLDWKKACLESGITIRRQQIRHLYPPSKNQ